MTVETLDSTLQDIEFPAITLCSSNDFPPDNWDLTEKVLNSFKFNCEVGDEDCKEVRNVSFVMLMHGIVNDVDTLPDLLNFSR